MALGRALPNSLSYAAFTHLPVGVVVLIYSMIPMATLLIALAIRIEHLDVRRLTGLGLGTLAILMIVLPKTSLPSPDQAIWILLPVSVALCYAGEGIYIAKAKPPDCDVLTMMCGITWSALITLTPAVIVSDAWVVVEDLGREHANPWEILESSLFRG